MTKTTDFLESLMDNPGRAKILRLFLLNKENFTLTEIARRAGVGPRAARSEIELLKKLGLIKEEKGEGKTAASRKRAARYTSDPHFKYMNALSTFIHEVSPEEYTEVENALRRTGRVSVLVLSGVFTGDLTRPADLLIAGDYMNDERLEKVVRSFEQKYGREIRYAVFSTPEFRYRLTIKDKIIRDILDYPHRLLVNRGNLV